MKKYWIITYGCQMNKSDSERIAALLENIGWQKAQKIDGADLIVVNMCSVRQSAVDRIYGLLPKFKKLKIQNSKFKIILTGCLLEKDRKKFAEHFDYILDIKNLPKWPKLFSQVSNDRHLSAKKKNYKAGPGNRSYLKIQPKYSSFPVAYVPISTGCNNFCSYCVVPYTRGQEVCRPVEEIIYEVKNLVKRGYKEIWLLGQNVNSYKVQGETEAKQNAKLRRNKKEINFAKLLKMINAIPGKFWVRFTSPHPKDFSNELIEVIANGKKIAKKIHLPLQSGNNEILKKMNRNYTVEEYKNLVKRIRQKMGPAKAGGRRAGWSPEVSLSTDIIVGFPGETKKQFEDTVNLIKEVKFNQVYVAAYSPRPGTVAAKLKDSVPSGEKKRRKKILLDMFK
ncbi:MAG: tRNA (N6-isopentenyl adenosine(37)-C2)-methylthiotransferase MiaB [Patescibacteria group bacterium]|nr:tRNA (N6-isopentenyl adenosine(37)-C2)-methylthiotransferase MiaB [Patescibacteria group bacterium]